MKTFIKVAMVVGLIAALVLGPLSAVGVAENRGFEGAWEATDKDGSHEKMAIFSRASGEYRLILRDSWCSGEGLLCPCIAFGTGNVEGNRLQIPISIRCRDCPGCDPVIAPDFYLDYNESSDTLLDATNVTWFRAGTHLGTK